MGESSYDYIVVGGGTAGTALAARLSLGLPDAQILLIEAGPDAADELRINVPGKRGTALKSEYDWNFTSIPQEAADSREFAYARGKVLGGSSSLNLMTYDRASVAEYDAWGALGNEGWGWEVMIEAMMKAETFTGKNTETYGEAGVGDSWPVQAVINRYIPQQQDAFIPTLNAMGVESNLESLGGNPLGVMLQPSSVDPGPWTRSTGASAYLPIAGSNLRVMPDTTVLKVNIESKNDKKVATGVTLSDGTVITAKREVVLSAGSIQSPGLLENSGVGQKAILDAAGVEQILELPGVGENFQDHMRVMAVYQLRDGFMSFDNIQANETYAEEQLELWKAGELGAYDYTGSGYAFMNWPQVTTEAEVAELKVLAEEAVAADPHVVMKMKLELASDMSVPQMELVFSDGHAGSKGYPKKGEPGFGSQFSTLISALQHPFSRGSVHVNAADPTGPPAIDPRFFTNEHDVRALVAQLKYARRAAGTAPMADLWQGEDVPGADVTDDEALRKYVLESTLSIFHPVGTCAMLPEKDQGVVDSELRVHGVEGLRVVDASVIPMLISAHIQTAVYGIAEIAAQKMIASAA
ncbi:GMC family oxidoreductase [Candidatus Bathyarchaeota archaeon]|nr:GMC family oxidoreductase [Candidatus Bathyarchaeota archaeon]